MQWANIFKITKKEIVPYILWCIIICIFYLYQFLGIGLGLSSSSYEYLILHWDLSSFVEIAVSFLIIIVIGHLIFILFRYVDVYQKPTKEKIILYVILSAYGLIFNYIMGGLIFGELYHFFHYVLFLIAIYLFTCFLIKSIKESVAHYDQGGKFYIFYPSLSKFLTATMFLAIGILSLFWGFFLFFDGTRPDTLEYYFTPINIILGSLIGFIGIISLLLLVLTSCVLIKKFISKQKTIL